MEERNSLRISLTDIEPFMEKLGAIKKLAHELNEALRELNWLELEFSVNEIKDAE